MPKTVAEPPLTVADLAALPSATEVPTLALPAVTLLPAEVAPSATAASQEMRKLLSILAVNAGLPPEAISDYKGLISEEDELAATAFLSSLRAKHKDSCFTGVVGKIQITLHLKSNPKDPKIWDYVSSEVTDFENSFDDRTMDILDECVKEIFSPEHPPRASADRDEPTLAQQIFLNLSGR